jgi:hypothetical protein
MGDLNNVFRIILHNKTKEFTWRPIASGGNGKLVIFPPDQEVFFESPKN